MTSDIQTSGATTSARWDVELRGGAAVVRLTGEIDLAVITGPADGLLSELERAAATSTLVICDLSGVSFMDSSGLHLLFKLRDGITERAGRFVVARPSEAVRRVFDLVSASDVLEIVGDA